MSEPCRCDAPNPSCLRAGVPMVGHLHGLCRGDSPHGPEKSERYREMWDRQTRRPKPRMSVDELAAVNRCRAAKAMGLPCPDEAAAVAAGAKVGYDGGSKSGGASMKTWACGVTTVPSRVDLLGRTLASIQRAGFPVNRLFVDGVSTSDLPPFDRFGLPLTAREPKLGPWGNWFLALHELNVRHPGADRFAIFQDDLEMCLGVREYLDASELPFNRGYLNLFCFLDNHELLGVPWQEGRLPAGWHVGAFADRNHPRVEMRNRNQRGIGALALVFDRAGLELMLSSKGAAHKPLDPRFGDRHVDGQAAATFNAAGLREMVHVPSLVRHLGEESTIDKRPLDQRLRFPEPPPGKFWTKNAMSFPGPDFDALGLLPAERRAL